MTQFTADDFSPKAVRHRLFAAAKIKVPSFQLPEERTLNAQQKIATLEDHLILVSRWRAVLEECLLYMQSAVKDLEDQWDEIEGWEMLRQGDTQKAITEAKRKLKPEVYDGIREGKWIADKLQRQIRRLERDEEFTVSRAYTIITGG